MLLKDELDLRGHPDRAGHFLAEIDTIGTTFLRHLLNSDHGWKQFRMLFRLAVREQERRGLQLRIDLQTPKDWPIPLEILPLGQRPRREPPRTAAEVAAYAKVFPAFQAVLRHTLLDVGKLPTERRIAKRPGIRLLFLWYDGAAGAAQALQSISSLPQPFLPPRRPEDVLPSEGRYDSTEKLARLLVEQGEAVRGEDGGTRYSVVHIHAHADTGKPSTHKAHTLKFAFRTRPRWWFRGRLHEVLIPNGKLDVEAGDASRPRPDGPLLFVNACGGAAGSHSGGLGLAHNFLLSGYRAVIGPRVSVPGQVAECLARYFYEALPAPLDLGGALLAARRGLLSKYCNPLGALYTIHGESQLYID